MSFQTVKYSCKYSPAKVIKVEINVLYYTSNVKLLSQGEIASYFLTVVTKARQVREGTILFSSTFIVNET